MIYAPAPVFRYGTSRDPFLWAHTRNFHKGMLEGLEKSQRYARLEVSAKILI
jgi:hypothetical protein